MGRAAHSVEPKDVLRIEAMGKLSMKTYPVVE
jgi:hypothetical protein